MTQRDVAPVRLFVTGPGRAGKSALVAHLALALGSRLGAGAPYRADGGWSVAGRGDMGCPLVLLREKTQTAAWYDPVRDRELMPEYAAEADFLAKIDGAIFVTDSQELRHEANVEALANFGDLLRRAGNEPARVVLAIALNKRDLANVVPVERMVRDLVWPRCVHLPTVATAGMGVVESLNAAIHLVTSE